MHEVSGAPCPAAAAAAAASPPLPDGARGRVFRVSGAHASRRATGASARAPHAVRLGVAREARCAQGAGALRRAPAPAARPAGAPEVVGRGQPRGGKRAAPRRLPASQRPRRPAPHAATKAQVQDTWLGSEQLAGGQVSAPLHAALRAGRGASPARLPGPPARSAAQILWASSAPDNSFVIKRVPEAALRRLTLEDNFTEASTRLCVAQPPLTSPRPRSTTSTSWPRARGTRTSPRS
jgi:hypothetical protein